MDNSLELLVYDCLDEALRDYPQIQRAYLHDAEMHAGIKSTAEVLTTVIVVMQHEGVDALTAKRVILRTWQLAFEKVIRTLAGRA